MKTTFLKISVVIICIALLSGCSGTKKISGYNANQTKPSTAEQASAANRGIKLQREECEELALDITSPNLRAVGNGISAKESMATNIALLQARSDLAQQLEVLVFGLMRNYDQQHENNGADNLRGKSELIQNGYFNQFLTNTRSICKNTYVKEDGKYNVYVCVEMGEQQQRAMHKKLTQDEIISIDFAENQFLKELEKAKKEYVEKLAQE